MKTSHGRVETEVEQTVNFSNVQNFTINALTYVQDINQNTQVNSATITRDGFNVFATIETFHYPLNLDIVLGFPADGTVSQTVTSTQQYVFDGLAPYFAASETNKVTATDTLNFDVRQFHRQHRTESHRRTTLRSILQAASTPARSQRRTACLPPRATAAESSL